MVDLGPAVDQMQTAVQGVRDDQLGAPTPCAEYALGDLLDHIGGVARAFTAAAKKASSGPHREAPPPGDAARLEEGWRDRITADLNELVGAWRDPAAWDGTTHIAGMEMPAAVVGSVAVNELIVHGWDVARATGQPFDADAELLDACFEFMAPLADPEMEEQRQPAFGPVLSVDDDAPPLERLVGLNGRDPSWSTRV